MTTKKSEVILNFMDDIKPIFAKDMISQDDIKPILLQRALSLVSSIGDAVDTFSIDIRPIPLH